MKVKIGIKDNPFGKQQADFTQKGLERLGVETVLSFYADTLDLEAAVQRGDIDVAAHHLKDLSTHKKDGLVITALSSRNNPADILVLKKVAFDAQKSFRIKGNARIAYFSAIQKAQINHFRSDLNFIDDAELEQLGADVLISNEVDAMIVSAAELPFLGLDKSAFEFVELFPKEIIPAAGQGVTAWQVNPNDLPTRRVFKKLHQTEVSTCTNIERKIIQLLDEKNVSTVAAYCDRDRAGNLHVSAVYHKDGTLKRVSESATTHLGMAERIVERLMAVEA